MNADDARQLIGRASRAELRDMVRRGQALLDYLGLPHEDWEQKIADDYQAWVRAGKRPRADAHPFLYQEAAYALLEAEFRKTFQKNSLPLEREIRGLGEAITGKQALLGDPRLDTASSAYRSLVREIEQHKVKRQELQKQLRERWERFPKLLERFLWEDWDEELDL